MARTSDGTFTRVSNSFTSPVTGTPISSAHAEAFFDDIDTEMTDSLSRTGKGGMSADLDMNNNDITEVKSVDFKGSTSGTTTVLATAIAGTTTLTLPAATDTLVGKATTDTLTNKSVNLANNTVTGTLAEFNTAVSDANLASLAGSETLTNKTIALGSNTVSGTIAQFNTAVTDADFATLAGSETLTNKTLTSPAINTATLTAATVTTSLVPTSDDGAALGSTANKFSDLFLASGAVVNFDSGDVTVTHSANTLAFAGASSGYTFDAPISGATTFGLSSYINLTEIASPSSPAANDLRLFAKDVTGDTHLFTRDSAGTEVDITAAVGGVVSAASQAQMEAASDTSVYASPGRTQFHPGVAKFWINFNGTGTIATRVSHNVTSITDDGVGQTTITIATDFSSADYAFFADAWSPGVGFGTVHQGAFAVAGSVQILTYNAGHSALTDHTLVMAGGFGDQA